MTNKPIKRHYQGGYTFRWVQGENRVAIKEGRVIEGRAVVVRPGRSAVEDRPNEVPGFDRHTWAGQIPVNPADWSNPGTLARAAQAWLAQNAQKPF